MPITGSEKASGKDKSDIYAVIAKLIFVNHCKYGATYHQNSKKFCDSVTNHIVGLKSKYKKLKARFSATGAGVLPGKGHANLFIEICAEWKWYADLDEIWHSNPAFAVMSHLFRPGVDHAGQMYSLTQPSHIYSCPPHPLDTPTAPALCNDPVIDPRLLQESSTFTDDPPNHDHPQVHLHGLSHTNVNFLMD
ncbi:hypothetical protein BDR07DRAFT_1484295 [Suillus spraguei]|nr:hypothetical protein BDR07DRAFT_1484295 [Suillus spraguei]